MNIVIGIMLIALGILLYYKGDEWKVILLDFFRGNRRLDTKSKEKKLTTFLNQSEPLAVGGISFGTQHDLLHRDHVIESVYDDEGHILCVGGSGLGKTSALLIPTLKSWVGTEGKFLVWDISGDIHPEIDAPDAIKYEPGNPESVPYYIFEPVDHYMTNKYKNRYRAIKELAKLALLLLPNDPNASEAATYYNKEGRKLLTAALIAFYFQKMDFIEICEKINYLSWQNLFNEIYASENDDAIKWISSMEGVDGRYNANAKQVCEDAVHLFSTDEDLKTTIRRPERGEAFFAANMVEKKNSFIIIDDSDLEYYSTLNQIIASQCLGYIAKRPLDHKNPILLCMDEAASLGQIDILPPLRKFRKRHCRIFMLTQSIADIDLTWGEKQRRAMMTNFKYKVILESSEPDEQEYWSRLCGRAWMWHDNTREKGDSKPTDIMSHERNVEPEEFANLGDDLILTYPGGYARLTKDFYFKKAA